MRSVICLGCGAEVDQYDDGTARQHRPYSRWLARGEWCPFSGWTQGMVAAWMAAPSASPAIVAELTPAQLAS